MYFSREVPWEIYLSNRGLFSLKKKVSVVIPAYLKKKEERIPCAALLHMRNSVALE